MIESRRLPDLDRLSVLAATILLAYTLARFVDLPASDLAVQLPGVYLSVQVNVRTVVAVLVASLTATGADWLLRQHPKIHNHNTLEHWLLPALTALVIGIPLLQLPNGPPWWVGVFIGGAVLMFVLVAEYITVDPEDIRHPLAAAGLTILSFALYLILAITLRIAGFRLFLLLPALTLAAAMISLRTLHLRLHGRWAVVETIVIALICAQLIAGLHYLPLSPVSFGLLLLGPTYSLISLIANLAEDQPLLQAIIEPSFVMVIVFITALWLR